MGKLVILTLLFVFSNCLFSQEQLIFTTGEWAPFSTESEEGQGLYGQLMTEIFKEVGIDVKIEFMPWNRAFEVAKSGTNYAGTFAWYENEERKEDYFYSETPLNLENSVFFHRKDLDFDWKKAEDLQKYKIGFTLGYTKVGVIKEAEEKGLIELDVGNSDVANFRKLIHGRIDIFGINFNVGYDLLTKNFDENEILKITNHPKAIIESGSYLLVSKKHPKAQEILDQYEKGIKIIKEKGIYNKILGKQ